jgi:hypothetical protein
MVSIFKGLSDGKVFAQHPQLPPRFWVVSLRVGATPLLSVKIFAGYFVKIGNSAVQRYAGYSSEIFEMASKTKHP